MSTRSRLPALAVALACCAALSGCLTPHVRPSPSKAVIDARSRTGAKVAACSAGDLASVSPVSAGFAFDDPAITPAAQTRLAAAAGWLTCNPTVEVVVAPEADHHGDAAHMDDLAKQRALAVQGQLRSLGATANVIRLLPRGGSDPVTAPHMVIKAEGRGW
jgi:outer membrane protein OmpA-like peptidoglycan-associated protein